MSGPFDFSNTFGEVESRLWSDAFGEEFSDWRAEALYHESYFNKGVWESEQLSAIRDKLQSYLMDEYGIDFDAVFDWNAWREAYE